MTIDTEQTYHKLSWETVQSLCKTFAYRHINDRFKQIIPIARGGLVPATILSHAMNLPMLTPIKAASYDRTNQQAPIAVTISALTEYTVNPQTILIVDDILDTGNTTDAVMRHPILRQGTFLYLTHKGKVELKPNQLVLSEAPKDSWVVFPWE